MLPDNSTQTFSIALALYDGKDTALEGQLRWFILAAHRFHDRNLHLRGWDRRTGSSSLIVHRVISESRGRYGNDNMSNAGNTFAEALKVSKLSPRLVLNLEISMSYRRQPEEDPRITAMPACTPPRILPAPSVPVLYSTPVAPSSTSPWRACLTIPLLGRISCTRRARRGFGVLVAVSTGYKRSGHAA